MPINYEEKERLAHAFSKSNGDLINYRHILLDNDEKIEVAPAWYHSKWSDSLLFGKQHEAIQAFRESAKSQFVLRSFNLHSLTFPSPETDYIVLIKKNAKLAKNKLKEIWNEYLSNQVISGNLELVREQSGDAFDVDVTDTQGNLINVRIEAYGKGSSIRGLAHKDRRPKIVIIDDPQDKEDAFSETVQEADWDWFLGDVMFLGKTARIFLIGNNLGDRSIIERVFTNADELKFATQKIPTADRGLTKSNWPELFTIEAIRKERESYRKLGKVDIWYRERMCEALSAEAQKFKKENFQYYDHRKAADLQPDCNVFIRTDLIPPPKIEKGKGDKAAIVVLGIDCENRWFVFDVYNERVDPHEFYEQLFLMVRKWWPVINVGFPDVGSETNIEYFCRTVEMPKRKMWFDTIMQKQAEKKELRILSCLQPIVAQKRLMLPLQASWLPEIENQLLRFPKGMFDDIIDPLASGDQESFAPIRRTTVSNLPRRGKTDARLI